MKNLKELCEEHNSIKAVECKLVKVDEFPFSGTVLNTPNKVFETFKSLYKDELKEKVYLISCNTVGFPVAIELISVGTLDYAVISISDILRSVLLAGCDRFILMHNHPCGSLLVGNEDRACTKKLSDACEIMGMTFLDHVIFTNDSFVSLRDIGIIQ